LNDLPRCELERRSSHHKGIFFEVPLRLAIDQDWPLMAKAKESRAVTQALDALYASAMRLMENGLRQPEIFVEVFKQPASLSIFTVHSKWPLKLARKSGTHG
jgi:hypothetical protein